MQGVWRAWRLRRSRRGRWRKSRLLQRGLQKRRGRGYGRGVPVLGIRMRRRRGRLSEIPGGSRRFRPFRCGGHRFCARPCSGRPQCRPRSESSCLARTFCFVVMGGDAVMVGRMWGCKRSSLLGLQATCIEKEPGFRGQGDPECESKKAIDYM